MKRTILALALSALPLVAHAQTITLSCDGTVKDESHTPIPVPMDHTPKPLTKMGVVVNLASRTVSFEDYVVPISTADEASVTFGGTLPQGQYETYVVGTVDRVTGHMDASASTFQKGSATDTIVIVTHYDGMCRPAKPAF